MNDKIKLLPFPFCGGEAKPGLMYGHYVQCVECHSATAVYASEQKAAEAWNKRAEPMIAEWIPTPYDRKRGLCSNCSKWSDSTPKYCPNCGAYMINGRG